MNHSGAAFFIREFDDWFRCFDRRSLERGKAYAAAGKARILGLDDTLVEGECTGSQGQRYKQSISVFLNKDAMEIEGTCSCPVGLDCKHCAAVLFHLRASETQLPEPGTASPHLSPELTQWVAALENPVVETTVQTKREGRGLFYRVGIEDGHCYLRVYKGTRSGNGDLELDRPSSLLDLIYYPPRYVTETDKRVLRLIQAHAGNHDLSGSVLLEGSGGAQLLEHVLGCGRLLSDRDDVEFEPGPERQAEFRWVRQDDGSYRGAWYAQEHPIDQVLPLAPLYYVDTARHMLGKLRHELDPFIASQLAKAPQVPEHLIVPLSLRLSALNRQVPTPTTVRTEQLDQLMPRPRLTLGSVEFSAYSPKVGRMQRQLQHRAALSFDYDGMRAVGTDDKPLSRFKGEISQQIKRQPAAEQAFRKALKSLGFKAATRQSKALPDGAGEMLQLPDDAAWLHFVREGLPELRHAGWNIEVQRDFAFDLHEVQDWYAAVDEAQGREWFDLELGIVVEGQRHSLLPILLHLLRSDSELLRPSELARRADDEHLLIDLNGARHDNSPALRVALPYGRVKAVLGTLAGLYFDDAMQGPALRLDRADASRLDPIDDLPLQWQGGEQVRSLARRLRDARERVVQPPAGLRAQLRPYQLEGLSWLQTLRELEVGGILGDDMGLGKTLQTLAHLLCEKEAGRLEHPALVVMPTSLVPNWLDEAQRFTPQLRVVALQGAGRLKYFDSLHDYDLVLTTYALLSRDLERYHTRTWHVLVLDEAQNIKNPRSKTALAVRQLQARQRLCLTGTPMENNLGELWAIFHFLMPGWLGDSKRFNQDYRTPIERHGDTTRLAHLVARIRPFLLRRTKEQVARELPPKTEIVHWVDLSDAQRDTYETVRVAMDRKVRDEVARKGTARSQIIILEALLKLRQVCCDLRLVKGLEEHPGQTDKGKLGSLLEMLDELLSEDRRVLLFSQFTSMLALIAVELDKRKVRYSLLTGDTRDRRTPVQAFQEGDSQVFLISLKAGGTGLNLTAADTVIHFDPWWNPASENQATDRAYRIGQDKPVFVYKLITRGTVEEKIQQLQQEKAALAAGLLEGGEAGQWRLGDEEIDALFAPLPGKQAGR
ncbi:DEAD/DEAH box helicase [Pseudomonas fulva]|nr:DEAD/DEAH box helicase [Pseudomonas fulva]MBF8781141.1 DEAD/DEAH box helicase [Pseudomonas fulva]